MASTDSKAAKSTDAGLSVKAAGARKTGFSPRSWRFWLILLFAVYTLGGFFLAPWLIERLAVKRVQELGRTLTIQDVKVNPFVLSIELTQTELRDTDGELLFSYSDYFWNFQLSSLFRRAWTFSEIRLDGLWLNFERFRPGEDRIGRLVDAFPQEEKPERDAAAADAALPRLIVQNFRLNDGRLALTDHIDGEKFEAEYGPINIAVNNLSTLSGHTGDQQVSITTSEGGSIAWHGTVNVAEFKSQGHFSIQGKSMAAVHRYLDLHLPFTTGGEAAEFEFDYKVLKNDQSEWEVDIDALSADAHALYASLPDAEGRLLDLPKLSVAGASLRWPERVVRAESMVITDPRLNLVRMADGQFNIQSAITVSGTEEDSAVISDEGDKGFARWDISLGRFEIENGTAALMDETLEPPAQFGLDELGLALDSISNQEGAAFPTRLSLGVVSGGSLEFEGELTALPRTSAEGTLSLTDFQLQVVQPWLGRLARVRIDQGALSLNGEVLRSPDEPGSFKGSVQVVNFGLQDTLREEELTGWTGLEINRAEISLAEKSINTSEIELTQPYGRLAIAEDKTTNLSDLRINESKTGVVEPEVAGSESPALENAMSFTIGGVEIADARMDFSDLSLPLPFAVAIRSLDGTVSTLASNSIEPARIQMEGQVNEFGSAQIGGAINAWDYTDNTDIQMKFRNLEMANLTPYSIQFAGYRIESGRLDLDLDYEVQKGKMLGDNKIIARQLTIGEKVEHPDAVSLPLKLGVALLKDSDGVIDVDLPVSGDLNDPEFRIGGIVMKAIFNLLTKIVTSPFRLLGNLVGVDSEDFGTLSFQPGRAEVSPPDKEKLIKLAEAMGQRPELQLAVSGVFAEESDRAALQALAVDSELEVRIEQAEQDSEALSTTLRRLSTEALFQEKLPGISLESVQANYMKTAAGPEGDNGSDDPAAAVLDETAYVEDLRRQLIAQQPVTQQELESLARARADAVLAVLLIAGGENPISVQQADLKAVEAGEGGSVSLELSVTVND